jgi:hypothetical protein
LVALLCAAGLSACTTMGTGTGSVSPGNAPVRFSGQDMRCRFDLNDPVEGMSSGGQGKCELKGGPSVDAVFNREG